MPATLAFDVYGTLIDTSGVVSALERLIGDRAPALSDAWRTKQLEYSFRRGLMQNYRDFAVCTRQALDWACEALKIDLPDGDKNCLLAGYRELPAFPDARTALASLHGAGHRLFAFSNGRSDDVRTLLHRSGLAEYILDVVSTGEICSFKPNPAVYAHFLRRAGAVGAVSWMVSGNPFDVIGAVSAGLRAAWVRRDPETLFDPWEIRPTAIVSALTELEPLLSG
jgi:2-haloacid dehalogenase